jgi:hypothetical protein
MRVVAERGTEREQRGGGDAPVAVNAEAEDAAAGGAGVTSGC